MLFSIAAALAQTCNPFLELKPDSSLKWAMGVFANYNIGSNAITNGFLNGFYEGRFINDSQKDRVEKKMSHNNRIGGDINGGIYYLQKRDSLPAHQSQSWFFSVKNRQHADAGFSPDLFHVAFYGNASYSGRTADFDGFSLNVMQYQQFQAGFTGDRFAVGLSVYNGQQYLQVQAKKAQLYTSADGQYLDFNTAYTMRVSNANYSNPGALNGIGTGLDLFYRLPVELRKGQKADFIFELSDLGFIRWNKQTNQYKNDTLYHFDGIAIKNAFQLADSTVHYSAKSTFNAKPVKQAAYVSNLPTTMDIKYVPLGTKYQFVYGIRYSFASNYVPYGYVQFRYHFGARYTATAEMGYGGYANLQTGLTLHAQFKQGFSALLGTNNLFGYLFPLNSCGQGLYVSVSKVFR